MCKRSSTAPNPSKNSRIICYLVGNEGLLLVQASGQLYRLNTSAAYIWFCREEGLSPLAIAGELADKFGIATPLARRDVVRALSDWRSLGLLDDTSHVGTERSPDHSSIRSNSAKHPCVLSASAAHATRHYRLLDIHIQVRYPCQKTETLIHPIFAHLETRSDMSKHTFEVIFEIAEAESNYVVLAGGNVVSDCAHLLELGPIIQREALLTAYMHTDCLMAIHAAAVCGAKNKCVLLPGSKGSGKSTLTAALIGSGFTYLTDELVLLMPDNRLIRPTAVSLGLKRGSWPILAPAYSTLADLPEHFQEGNASVRYLPPPKVLLPEQEAYPVEYLVFPKYGAGEKTSLGKLSPAEAIYRVAQAGYAVPGCIDTDLMEDFIDWITQLNCYELRMGDLNEAVSKIKELVR